MEAVAIGSGFALALALILSAVLWLAVLDSMCEAEDSLDDRPQDDTTDPGQTRLLAADGDLDDADEDDDPDLLF